MSSNADNHESSTDSPHQPGFEEVGPGTVPFMDGRMKPAQISFFAFFGLMFAALLFWSYARTEAYCFFAPAVDTQFAAGFSEAAFAEITVGMSAEIVREKLGEPLRKHFHSGKETWCYTLDGKCWWGDWAWLCREVIIQDGFVNEAIKRVNYD